MAHAGIVVTELLFFHTFHWFSYHLTTKIVSQNVLLWCILLRISCYERVAVLPAVERQ